MGAPANLNRWPDLYGARWNQALRALNALRRGEIRDAARRFGIPEPASGDVLVRHWRPRDWATFDLLLQELENEVLPVLRRLGI